MSICATWCMTRPRERETSSPLKFDVLKMIVAILSTIWRWWPGRCLLLSVCEAAVKALVICRQKWVFCINSHKILWWIKCDSKEIDSHKQSHRSNVPTKMQFRRFGTVQSKRKATRTGASSIMCYEYYICVEEIFDERRPNGPGWMKCATW